MPLKNDIAVYAELDVVPILDRNTDKFAKRPRRQVRDFCKAVCMEIENQCKSLPASASILFDAFLSNL